MDSSHSFVQEDSSLNTLPLNLGSDGESVNHKGEGMLFHIIDHLALGTNNQKIATKIHLPFIRELIQKDPGLLNQKNSLGEKPLLRAARYRNHSLIKLFLEHGADTNTQDQNGITPLYKGIQYMDEKLVKRLISYQTTTGSLAYGVWAPLHLAIYYHSTKMTQLLIEANDFDPSLKTVYDQNLLHCAINYSSTECLKLLLDHPQCHTLLNEKNIFGETPLQIALRNKNDEIITLLMYYTTGKIISKDFIPLLEGYGQDKRIRIDQIQICEKIKQYILKKVPIEELNQFMPCHDMGHCAGLSFLFIYYASQGSIEEFYESLEKISTWDGTITTLKQPYSEPFGSGKYGSLEELMEQWTNDILFFQNLDNFGDSINQFHPTHQYKVARKNPHSNLIHFIHENCELEELFTWDHSFIWIKILQKEKMVGHKVALAILENNTHFFYDPNLLYRTLPFFSLKEAAESIKRAIEYQTGGKTDFIEIESLNFTS